VYGYFAEYLGQVTRMNGSWISIMLMVFGISMIAGIFLFGRLMYKSMAATVILYPLVYAVIYILIYVLGADFFSMAVIVIVWGVVHAGGVIVSQALLMTEAREAPEFGNSLFVSFSNVGITLGVSIGGWFVSQWSTHQLGLSGIMFALLAFLLILVRNVIFKSNVEKANMVL
jgi:predicted MFS family arabinose efflux permease